LQVINRVNIPNFRTAKPFNVARPFADVGSHSVRFE
jgi:hypothetical protein